MIHDLSQSNIFTQHEIIIKVLIISTRGPLRAFFTRQHMYPYTRYLTMAVKDMKQAFVMFTIT